MNPWTVLWDALGWVLVAFVSLMILLITLGFLERVYSNAVGAIRAKRQAKQSKPSQDDYMKEARSIAHDMYNNGPLFMAEAQAQSFAAGALWGWGFHHRKPSP